jgi:predicted NAD/FAD-binding protein
MIRRGGCGVGRLRHAEDDPIGTSVRIAVVGAGVSGLIAAHLLQREHEIVVYEAGHRAGLSAADATEPAAKLAAA